MSYKRYIKVGGKLYGPYEYHSFRDSDGSVKSEYVKKIEHDNTDLKKKVNFFQVSGLILLILLLSFIVLYFSGNRLFTGHVILDLPSQKFNINENVNGNLGLEFGEGEFYPADSIIRVVFNNQTVEMPLKDFMSLSTHGLEEKEADFYTTASPEIQGHGLGYGIYGYKEIPVDVFFKLKIMPALIINETNQTNETNISIGNETNITEINITEENVTEINITQPEENQTEPEPPQPPEENKTTPETPPQETPPPQEPPQTPPPEAIPPPEEQPTPPPEEQPQEPPQTPPAQETPPQETPSTPSESTSTPPTSESSESSSLTGSAIGDAFEIDGKCIKGEDFTYNLFDETAELVSGTVKTENESLNDSDVDVKVETDKVTVSTDYVEEEQGYGKDYITRKIKPINLSLEIFNITSGEPGIYDLEISFVYNNITISSTSTQIIFENLTNETNVSYAPLLLKPIPDIIILKNTNYSLNLSEYFIDYDNETLNFISDEIENISTIFDNEIATLIPDENFTGNRTTKFYASDGINTTESNLVDIFVVENITNQPPVLIQEIPNQTIMKNQNGSIELSKYFMDPDNDTLTFNSTQPENISVNFDESLVTLIPDENFTGNRTIIFNASDGNFTIQSNLVYIFVIEQPVENVSITLVSSTSQCLIDCESVIDVYIPEYEMKQIALRHGKSNTEKLSVDKISKAQSRLISNKEDELEKNIGKTKIKNSNFEIDPDNAFDSDLIKLWFLKEKNASIEGFGFDILANNTKNESEWLDLSKEGLHAGHNIIRISIKREASLGDNNIDWKIALNLTDYIEPDLAWWNSSWIAKKPINVWVSSGSTETDYTVMINISYDSDMNANFSDLRFADDDNTTELDYWIQEQLNSYWATVWVEIKDAITTTNQTIYIYYKNPVAASKSNISNAFLFGDDFNDNSISGSWNFTYGAWNEMNSMMNATCNTTDDPTKAYAAIPGSPSSYAVMAKVRPDQFSGDTRLGVSAKMDSGGAGYNTLIRPDNTSQIDLLSDGTAWANLNYYPGFTYSTGNWYWFEISVMPSMMFGDDLQGRSWKANYAKPDWKLIQSWSDKTGTNAGLHPGYWDGETTQPKTSFDDFIIRKFANPEPSYAIGGEQSIPNITFVSPTPDNASTSGNNVYLNTTIASSHDDSAFFDWNYSLGGYWAMDWNYAGMMSDTVYDNSTYNNHGTMNGFFIGSINNGKYSKGIDFTGASEYISVNSADSINPSNFTLEYWINVTQDQPSSGSAPRITAKDDYSFETAIDGGAFLGDNKSLYYYDPTDSWVNTNYDFTWNTWTHLVWTYDGTTLKLYVNGRENYSGAATISLTGNLYLGNINGGGEGFKGQLDEVRLYSRVLGTDEINASYNNSAYRLSHNFTNLADGSYDYYAFAIDTLGNWNKTGLRNVIVHGCGCSNGTYNYICGETVTSSCSMNCNLTSAGTCFTVGASNIWINGSGYAITGDGTGYGIRIPVAGPITYNNVTIKNFAINQFYSGIYADSSDSDTIFNNTFDLNKKAGIFVVSSDYMNITKNTNTNTSSSCIYYGDQHCSYVNTSDESGIALCDGSSNNRIEDFTLYGNNTNTDTEECGVDAGIAIGDNSLNNTVYNANLYYPDTYGILIQGLSHNTNISRLNVYGENSQGKSTNDAIIQGANIENLTFTHSYMENTSEWGPFLDASINAYMENLTIKNANKTGIRLTTNSTNATIKDSYVNNSKTTGIYMEYSTNATIANNNVSFGCTDDGLYISGSNNNLTNNIIYSTYENFHLENCSNSNLSDNIAYNSPLANGFFIRNSSGNNFTHNEVYNTDKGFYLDSSDSNAFYNNLAYNNTDVGFRISLGSDNNNLTNNTAYNNSYHGLFIYFQSYYNTIINNIFYNNGFSGIYLQQSDNGVLTNNTAYNNTQWDVYITDSQNNTFINQTIAGTTLVTYPTMISFTYDGDVSLKGVTSPPADPSGYRNISKYVNATNSTAGWLYLNVSYNTTDLSYAVENTLNMSKHNGSWYTNPAMFASAYGVNTSLDFVYVNITNFGSLFAPMGRGTGTNCTNGCLYVRNITNANKTIFDKFGNVDLAGFLTQNSVGSPDGSDLIFKDTSNANVAWIDDATGNMRLKGALSQNNGGYCSPPANSFIIKDNSSNCVAYIDSDGKLWLKGALVENAVI